LKGYTQNVARTGHSASATARCTRCFVTRIRAVLTVQQAWTPSESISPGVAPDSAAIFLGLIGDPRAYDSSRQILKLAGMSLVERSSGSVQGQPRISKRGKPLLRRQAFMLALRAVRSDGMFRARFEAHVARNGGRKMPVVVAVAREMLRLMYSVARERRPYTIEPPAARPRVAEPTD
jgi:transposase